MSDRRWTTGLALVAASVALILVPASPGAASPGGASPWTGHPGAQLGSADTSRSGSALEVQRRLLETGAAHSRALHRVDVLRRHLADLTELVDHATAVADREAAAVDTTPGLLDAMGSWAGGDEQLDRAHRAMDEAQHARELAEIAAHGLARAKHEVRTTAREHHRARAAADRLELSTAARASARLARDWSRLAPDYHASSPEQDERNRRTLAGWHRQLDLMAAAGIAPPTARALADRRLPGDLRPVRDGAGRVIPGVALARGRDGNTFTVLPDVTVRAVSTALSRLGVTTRSPASSCAEFVREVWASAQVDVPGDGQDLWQSLTAAPERQVVMGDVVFFRRQGGLGIGLTVASRHVVAFDPTAGEVVVEKIAPSDLLAVRRVTLPASHGARVAAVPDVVARGCSPAPTSTPVIGDIGLDGWSLPVADGSFALSAGFGDGGSLWSSGSHTGQDFAAPSGTPVTAASAGRVTVQSAAWAGMLVRIDHGDGVETWYGHMSRVDVDTGDLVDAGTVIGSVGSEGNSTGPHLHFEVRRDGAPLDPMTFLTGASGL